jgi:2-polyprenyl-3-methyl-5-hydroxy-6-metoxy-1,4-benzoquinol methylase
MSGEVQENFDQVRAEAFRGQMIGVLNGGMLGLLCSIGRQTDLFDTMDGMGAATSVEIAAAAGLEERYVREWLAAVACGGIVEHDTATGTFCLPAEHAQSLTKAAGAQAITHFCQYIAELGKVEQDLVGVFRDGGGVPYDRYSRFTQLMAESSGTRFDAGLLEFVVPILPGGAQRLAEGVDVADVGCGSGRAINLLAAAYPASRFVGFDFSEEGIEVAKTNAQSAELMNASFEARDAAALDLHERFDMITSFDAVHDQAHPDKMLAGIFEALRHGGSYLCVEPKASSHVHENLEHPLGPFLYGMSTMHCMTVSLAYGGEGLGAAWGEQLARQRMTKAGFIDLTVESLPHDALNNYFIAHKPD